MKNSNLEYKYFYRRNLPHIQPKGYLFFITYRLEFILPDEIRRQLKNIKDKFNEEMKSSPESEFNNLKTKCNDELFDLYDDYLWKRKQNPHWLKNNKIADIVRDSLFFNHKKLYKLVCFTIMSNHVHIIIKPKTNPKNIQYSLAKIMKDHKSYTANEANKILTKHGQFWHHENYDHFIRDRKDFNRIVGYILENQVKAGLAENYQDWKYSWFDKNP
ncbi:MAG: transposase [Candidatus Cloacimonadota bacterium]|nr:transposase [Candidatus Cloacimonadota bacterium]